MHLPVLPLPVSLVLALGTDEFFFSLLCVYRDAFLNSHRRRYWFCPEVPRRMELLMARLDTCDECRFRHVSQTTHSVLATNFPGIAPR